MAKSTKQIEPEEEVAGNPPAGGSGGSAGYAPVRPEDFETEQDKAKLDKSIGGPSAEEAEKRNKAAEKGKGK